MLINTANLTTLFQSYNAAFKGAFTSVAPHWNKIAMEVPSTTESNLYAFLGQFPKMREWLGDRHIKNMAMHSYTLTNKDFESTVAVERNKIEDDTYGSMAPLMAEMGYAAAVHPDEETFTLLAAGATNLCYDGQNFFDTDHPVIQSGVAATVANYDATGGGNLWCLMDTRRPLKPMILQKRRPYNFQTFTSPSEEYVFMKKEFLYGVDARLVPGFGIWQTAYGSLNTLNATNFDAAVTAMNSFRSDEDRPLGIDPTLLVCGPSNRTAARDLIETERLANGATNPNYKAVEVLVSPYLT
jgi:phage major head subunit gpT-like protein